MNRLKKKKHLIFLIKLKKRVFVNIYIYNLYERGFANKNHLLTYAGRILFQKKCKPTRTLKIDGINYQRSEGK